MIETLEELTTSEKIKDWTLSCLEVEEKKGPSI
jgi:hypothetical protein